MVKPFKLITLVAVLTLIPLGSASAAKAHATFAVSVDPASHLVYGGQAVVDISASGYGSDTANLFTYCTQNGTTWLENSTEVIGFGIKGVASPIVVDLPSAGSYAYDWTGGAATCHSDLYVYTWHSGSVTSAGTVASAPFSVAP